ncbi:MAG: PD40 domain-containing protein [Chloroflexi bacterium]|nr:PD40 domain-containing protein [Chloroflexota bacterium]
MAYLPHRNFVSLILAIFSLCACNPSISASPTPIVREEQLSAPQRQSLVTETLLADFGSSRPAIAVAPDHLSIAYQVSVDSKVAVVWKGKQGGSYDSIFPKSIKFSPDSQHIAYIASRGKKWMMVVNEVEDPSHDFVNDIYRFSADSQQVIYSYVSDNKSGTITHVIGKQSYETNDNISSNPDIVISADGRRKAIRQSIGGDIGSPNRREYVIVDGQQGKVYRSIKFGSIRFSSDSQHVAYVADIDDNFKSTVVLDGRETKIYDRVDTIVFSADSQHIAYVAEANYQDFVVLDSIEQKHYRGVSQITFSPDSHHLAYAVNRLNHSSLAIIDGDEVGPYDHVGSFVFSPDSQRIAFVAEDNKKQIAIIDRIEEGKYDFVVELIFSPDSKHIAYIAQKGERVFVVVDGTVGPIYDGIAFVECECDRPIAGRGLNFDTPNVLHYLAMKGNRVYLIKEEIQ